MPAPASTFEPLPDHEPLRLRWPTPNRLLLTEPEQYFARTRVNPDYGRPGWTRDCGKRWHRGCDIAPVNTTATGRTTTVQFTDCATGTEYPSDEPMFVPHDEVYAVCDGRIVERIDDPAASDYGRHLVIGHRWPRSGRVFYTLYAHLAEIAGSPAAGDDPAVAAGQRIGRMGQTARSADARNWMAVAPHLHFEAWDHQRRPYDPAAFLARYLGQAAAP